MSRSFSNILVRGDRAIITAADIHRVVKILRPAFSYEVKGAEFSEAYQDGKWDGRKQVFKTSYQSRQISLPAGLAMKAFGILESRGFTCRLDFEFPEPNLVDHGRWNFHDPRPYQERARDLAVKKRRGVLLMPIRSGKTLTSAQIIRALGERALFIAPSELLVRQAMEAFQTYLPDTLVTGVGGGVGDDVSGDIVVSSIQSLSSRRQKRWFEKMRHSFGTVFIDEVHHVVGEGDDWRETVIALNASNKFGLSGTLDLEDEQHGLWAEAVCGPVIFSLTTKPLVEAGHLLPPMVKFHKFTTKRVRGKWDRSSYGKHIAENADRNDLIARITAEHVQRGESVLVDVRLIKHARSLAKQIRALLPGKTELLLGTTKNSTKYAVMDRLAKGEPLAVVSTVLGEGVDVPGLAVVFNAEGGSDSYAATQRLRNLTAADGKTEAIVHECFDDHHPHALGEARKRLRMYRAIYGSKIELPG